MKIIQLTDPHLVGRAGELFGIDPLERLYSCLQDIENNHADACFCVITGDLAHEGEAAAYEALRKAIATLPMPCHLLLGNHDSRRRFVQIFPDSPRDENGYVQSAVMAGGAWFLFLDTNTPAAHSGEYGEARLNWLRRKLEAACGTPVYLFMHHPPMAIGIPSLDRIRLADPESLGAVLGEFNNVRHLFIGHVHRPISGSWRGIPFSTLPSLHHQVPLDLQTADTVPTSFGPPAYGVIFIDDQRTIVHCHSYLEDPWRSVS